MEPGSLACPVRRANTSRVRYLAIDLGDKRTGLAVGDTVTGMVFPAGTLEVPIKANAGEQLVRALVKAVAEQNPGSLVIGLPLNMNGTEGPRSRMVREFAQRVCNATMLPVEFQDERLTTAAADWSMARSGMSRGEKKGLRDQLAAKILLEDFLKAKRERASAGAAGPGGAGEPGPGSTAEGPTAEGPTAERPEGR